MGFLRHSNQAASQGDAEIPLTSVRTNASTTSYKGNDMFAAMMTSPEDEKVDVIAGRRRPKDLTHAGTGASEDGSLNAMGRLYHTIVGFSAVTRYLFYVLPIAILLAVPIVILPITHNMDIELGGGSTLFMLFVWIETSWLSLWVAKLVAYLLPSIFMFFCGVVSSGTRKYATVLAALQIPMLLFNWGLASWLVFKYMFTDTTIGWIGTVERILLAAFISAGVLLGEKAIVQLISITYHQRSFSNRINDSKREIYLLGLLYEASRTLFPMYCREFKDEDYIINDSIEMMLSRSGVKKRGHKYGASTNPARLVGDVGRIGDKITSVFGNIASEITGKHVFNPNSAHSIVVEALEKLRSSEAMARRIWMSFVVEGNDALYVEDVIEVLGPLHKEEAEEAFNAIDADQNGDISLDEMVRKVTDISKERKAITNSMKDIGQALRVFDSVLLFVVIIIVIIVFLVVFQSSFIATLATAGTTLLSLSFAFSVTTQEFLGSCIFLFVKHPFDVGDRVDIMGAEKEYLVVEKISLLFTVFTRIDKMQVVQVPNILLNNYWIENVTRSKAMREVIDINVAFDTSFEDIELLRLEMEKFVRAAENSRDFQPDITIGIGAVNDLDKLTLKVAIKYKSSWHNDAIRATRRSKFMCALALAARRVPIAGPGGAGDALGGPANPTYSVAVTDNFAAKAREEADKARQMLRLVNQTASSTSDMDKEAALSPDAAMAAEQAAAHINAQNPVDHSLDRWDFGVSHQKDVAGVQLDSAGTPATGDSLEAARQQHLMMRESQRGRRRAGETLPPMALSGVDGGDGGAAGPGVRLSRATSELSTRTAATSTTRNNPSIDIERQAAGGFSVPGGPYASSGYGKPAALSNSYQPPPAGPYPPSANPGSTFSTPPIGDAVTGQQHQQALLRAPTHGAASGRGATMPAAGLVVGARHRGASISGQNQGPSQSQQGRSLSQSSSRMRGAGVGGPSSHHHEAGDPTHGY